jgi:hypothetical protein
MMLVGRRMGCPSGWREKIKMEVKKAATQKFAESSPIFYSLVVGFFGSCRCKHFYVMEVCRF